MRIRKRWLLIVLVALAQLTCMLGAVCLFGNWLDTTLTQTLRSQILVNTRHIAEQYADLVNRMDIKDISPGSPDLTRLQNLIEQANLPNNGFLCVISNNDGSLVCHPDLKSNQSLSDARPGTTMLHTFSGPVTMFHATTRAQPIATGWATMNDGNHLIALRDMPDLKVKIVVHQRESAVDAVIAPMIRTVHAIGGLIGVLLLIVTAIVTTAIVQRYENRVAQANERLERLVDIRSRALTKTRDAVIFGLAKLAESRDDDTGEHLDRIRVYTELIAEDLRHDHPQFDRDTIRNLGLASSLHDIGKVGIPDAVLLKPGRLTPDERKIIEQHPVIGGECLLAIKICLGNEDFLSTACEITFGHHEKWNGSGYPYGRSGEQIPLSARIVALADVYDALTSKRVYKDAMPHDKAAAIIREGRGTHFDPRIVEAFDRYEAKFRIVAHRHANIDSRPQIPPPSDNPVQSELDNLFQGDANPAPPKVTRGKHLSTG